MIALVAGQAPAPKRAFYFWRTTMSLSPKEREALSRVDRLYVRVFDVAWTDKVEIVQPLSGELPAGDVVPVVFIREHVLRHADPAALATLIDARVPKRAELQIDCDWTETSAPKYFALLRALKKGGRTLSATIRLHQVKYRERTGVPPVDRGMLMFYNMGRIDADPATRAIFDAAQAKPYLERIADYPLAIDVALPVWSWVTQLREGKVVALLQALDPTVLDATPWLSPRDGRFVAQKTTFLDGELIREGDILEPETVGPEDVLRAAEMLAPRLPRRQSRTVTLFDLSERNLLRHDAGSLDRLFAAFR